MCLPHRNHQPYIGNFPPRPELNGSRTARNLWRTNHHLPSVGPNAQNAPHHPHSPPPPVKHRPSLSVHAKKRASRPTTAAQCLSKPSGVLCIISFPVWLQDVHILISTFDYLWPIRPL